MRLGSWSLIVDPQRSRDLYASTPGLTCDCDDCTNFREAGRDAFSERFLGLLESLGIDPTKPAELCHLGPSREPMPTQGWFHFVGRIVEGDDCWVESDGNTNWLQTEVLDDATQIGLSNRLSLVPEEFAGDDLVQLEFEATIPWVLATKNP